MKISKELIKGSTAMLVMSVLKKNDMYGYKIIKELELQSESVFELKEGTLYPILHALEEENLLESYWEEFDGRKYIQNQSKKFSAFQVCKTLITDRPFSVNLEFIAL